MDELVYFVWPRCSLASCSFVFVRDVLSQWPGARLFANGTRAAALFGIHALHLTPWTS